MGCPTTASGTTASLHRVGEFVVPMGCPTTVRDGAVSEDDPAAVQIGDSPVGCPTSVSQDACTMSLNVTMV